MLQKDVPVDQLKDYVGGDFINEGATAICHGTGIRFDAWPCRQDTEDRPETSYSRRLYVHYLAVF